MTGKDLLVEYLEIGFRKWEVRAGGSEFPLIVLNYNGYNRRRKTMTFFLPCFSNFFMGSILCFHIHHPSISMRHCQNSNQRFA